MSPLDPELLRASKALNARNSQARALAAKELRRFDPGRRPPGGSETHALTTDRLVKRLNADPDPAVRVECGTTLAGYNDAAAYKGLLRFLTRERASSVAARIVADAGLATGCTAGPLEKAAVDVVVTQATGLNALADLAASRRKRLAVTATKALAAALPQQPTTTVESLLGDSSLRARLVAAHELGKRREARATNLLIERLDDADDRMRMTAAAALGRIGDPRAIKPLTRAVLSRPPPRPTSRDAIWRPDVLDPARPDLMITALARFGRAAGSLVLETVAAADDLSAAAQVQAVRTLRAIGPSVQPALVRVLEAAPEDDIVRRVAAASVDPALGARVVPALMTTTEARDAATRAVAVAMLGRAIRRADPAEPPSTAAVDRLVAMAEDDSFPVRRAAETALSGLASTVPAVVPAVAELARQRPAVASRLLVMLASAPGMAGLYADLIAHGEPEQRIYALAAARDAVIDLAGDSRIRRAVRRAKFARAPGVRHEARETQRHLQDFESEPAMLLDYDEDDIDDLAAAAEAAPADFDDDRDILARVEALDAGVAAMRDNLRERLRQLEDDEPGAAPVLADDDFADELRRVVGIERRVKLKTGSPMLAPRPRRAVPRYPDAKFHRDRPEPEPLPEGSALEQATWYRLELAVRGTPQGVPAVGERRALREPQADEDVFALLVAIDSDDFEIEDPVGHVKLPRRGDSSESAWFRVRARRVAAPDEPARIEARIYYAFNLLEVVVIDAEVRARFADAAPPAPTTPRPPITLRQVRSEREYRQLVDIRPRGMHIDVERDGSQYRLAFAFATDGDEVVLRAPLAVTPDELDSELMSIRELWREIALESPFDTTVRATPEDSQREIERLADAGSRLWTMLFRRDMRSGLARVGELLQKHPPAPDSTVQISVGASAATFTFPWGLLYDRRRPRGSQEPADPNGFWGVRYAIEQGVPDFRRPPDRMAIVDERATAELQLAFMLWRRFRNAKDQIRLLDGFVKSAGGRLTVSSPPVLAANDCFALLQNGGSNILYFYTHGFTRRREAPLSVAEELDRFRRHYERLPEGDARRAALAPLYQALAEETATDRSYIELSYGKVFLDDLYQYIDELPARPLVLLNMCESAQVSPSLSDSFVHFFLNRGAPSLIGTECPMTVTFAHPFAEALLTRVLGGQSVGEAMLGARRHFLEAGNPLGLAYTLYGSAETYFRPPCLPATTTTI